MSKHLSRLSVAGLGRLYWRKESHGDAVRNLNWKCVPSRLHRTLHGERILPLITRKSPFLRIRIFSTAEKNPSHITSTTTRGRVGRTDSRREILTLKPYAGHTQISTKTRPTIRSRVFLFAQNQTSRRTLETRPDESLAVLGLALVLPAASGTNFRSAASTRGPLARAHFAPQT